MSQFTPLPADRQGEKLSQYFPVGRAWEAANDSDRNLGKLLIGLGQELYRLEVAIELLSNEFDIRQTTQLIREWETSVGIPDSCFTIDEDLQQRRDNVLVKIQDLGVRTTQDFVDVAALFGATVQIEPGAVHGVFPLLFPIAFYESGQTAKFTMIVDQPGVREVFPILFPIPFSAGIGGIIECLFLKLRPANVQIIFLYGRIPEPGFPPDQLAGLKLWLDADDASTITEAGGPGTGVSQWDDKSGNGYNASQLTVTSRPITNVRTINGVNTIDFDGVDDLMVLTEQPIVGTQARTIIIVGFADNGINQNFFVSLSDNSVGSGDQYRITAEIGIRIRSANRLFPDDAVDDGVNAAIITVTNEANSNIELNASNFQIYKNSFLLSGGTSVNEGFGIDTISGNAAIGDDAIGSLNRLDGVIGELIIYDQVLSASERQSIETYLSNKWGIVPA